MHIACSAVAHAHAKKTPVVKNKPPNFLPSDAPLGVFGIRDIRGKNYRDTGYLRKKLLGYRILRSSFRDTGYSQKIVTYQMFDEKRSRISKYMPFSVFLLICFIMLTGHTRLPLAKLLFIFDL